MSFWNLPSTTPQDCPEPRADTVHPALLTSGTWPGLAQQLRLSPRELEVVKGIFRDEKDVSIAAKLGISPHTVSTYLQRIYAKLRVASRPQLIVRVIAEYLRVVKSRRT